MRRSELEADPIELDSFPEMEDTFMAFSKPEEDLFDDEDKITLSGVHYQIDPLEELEEADLLLHVVDISNPAFEEQIEAVERILEELELQALERLIVFNKIDAVPDDLDVGAVSARFNAIAVSALDQPSLRPLTERLVAGIAPDDRGWRWNVL